MKQKRINILILSVIFLLSIVNPATAQDYSFELPEAEINVYMESDGSITIEYFYLFRNAPGAHPIDYVDVGMPGSSKYSFSNITATINDVPVTSIGKSEYVDGVELYLGANAIPAGSSGVVYMRAEQVRDVFYYASSDHEEDYASIQFQPNFFDANLSSGSTSMTVNLILPPGAVDGEIVWYTPSGWPGEETPASEIDRDGRIVYQWSSTNAKPSGKYRFGAAFPARLLPPDTLRKEQTVTFNPSELLGALVPIVCCGGFIGLFVLVFYLSIKSAKKRSLQYLPPKIAIEGHGIKRGLTSVEAAVLMEQPMDKILTMILFSVLRKNAAEVISRDPLEIKMEETMPEDLREYEVNFLSAFREPKTTRRTKLQDMMVSLVKSVGVKMKGFSRKETITYYEDIIKKAWAQVEAAETPEVRAEKYSEAIDWTMLDRDYDQRTRRTFGTGPVFMPHWWWRADPTIGRTSTVSAPSARPSVPSGGRSTTVTLPSLPGSNAAASVVNTVSALSAGVVGNLTSFTSGVTSKTNPPPKPTSSSFGSSGGRSSGGGSSCACACACAGCACACAGGGR